MAISDKNPIDIKKAYILAAAMMTELNDFIYKKRDDYSISAET
jgi:hypothetical protein